MRQAEIVQSLYNLSYLIVRVAVNSLTQKQHTELYTDFVCNL